MPVAMIIENDLFKHDWRSRSRVQVLQYIFLKWTLAFLVGLLTGAIASLINLAIENIAGFKLLAVARLVEKESTFITGFIYFTGANLALSSLCGVCTNCSWTRHSRNQSLSQRSQYTQHVCSINVDSQGLRQLLLNEHVSTQELAAVKWGGLLTFVGGNKGRHVICGNVDIINKQPGFWQSNFVVVQ
ncbi:hypothetical protein AAC387_Pa09g0768 [Persea americana]